MSDDVWEFFHLNALEKCLGIANELQAMLRKTKENPGRYDIRMGPILLQITGKVAEAARTLGDAGDLLKAFELHGIVEGSEGRLEAEIRKYLEKMPADGVP
jgi:hypothetical protein